MTVPAEIAAPVARTPRRRLKSLRRALLLLVLGMLVITMGQAEFRPTALELAMAPHRYSILEWELGHLDHKWTHALSRMLPGRREMTEAERTGMVKEFFDLGLAQRRLETQLRRVELGGQGQRGAGVIQQPLPSAGYLKEAIAENMARREELLPHVEHTVEETLTNVAREQGLETRWLGVFPPVDTAFGSPPNVLVLSPRDRIYRRDAFLLRPELDDAIKEDLEELALESEDLSAVVAGTGGLSVYPAWSWTLRVSGTGWR